MRSFAFALALLASPLAAQTDYTHTIVRIGNVSLMNHHPACNPFSQAFDPVWIHNEGWTMPRVAWHATYVGVNTGITYALMWAHVPRKIAAIVGPLPLQFIPHIRQAALGLKNGQVYELNLLDWIYDGWSRGFPAWALSSPDGRITRRNVAIWAAGDLALSCFARP